MVGRDIEPAEWTRKVMEWLERRAKIMDTNRAARARALGRPLPWRSALGEFVDPELKKPEAKYIAEYIAGLRKVRALRALDHFIASGGGENPDNPMQGPWAAPAILGYFYAETKAGRLVDVDQRVLVYLEDARQRYLSKTPRDMAKALGLVGSRPGNPGGVPRGNSQRKLSPDATIDVGLHALAEIARVKKSRRPQAKERKNHGKNWAGRGWLERRMDRQSATAAIAAVAAQWGVSKRTVYKAMASVQLEQALLSKYGLTPRRSREWSPE